MIKINGSAVCTKKDKDVEKIKEVLKNLPPDEALPADHLRAILSMGISKFTAATRHPDLENWRVRVQLDYRRPYVYALPKTIKQLKKELGL